jgi:hypothetical protein
MESEDVSTNVPGFVQQLSLKKSYGSDPLKISPT